MSSVIRQQRVTSLLFEELSIMIAGELSDPRISLARVTKVEITKDLRNAQVFVSHEDDDVPRRELLAALAHAVPYMRGQLAERLGLRVVPELLVYYDDAPEKTARVDQILREIAAERNALSQQAPTEPPAG
jgi:ribosome-binding factor A